DSGSRKKGKKWAARDSTQIAIAVPQMRGPRFPGSIPVVRRPDCAGWETTRITLLNCRARVRTSQAELRWVRRMERGEERLCFDGSAGGVVPRGKECLLSLHRPVAFCGRAIGSSTGPPQFP